MQRRICHRIILKERSNNMVRAKFFVRDKRVDSEGLSTIVLSAVINGSAENDSFFKYTPAGDMRLGTLNPAAAAEFVEGKEYYVDFTAAMEQESKSKK